MMNKIFMELDDKGEGQSIILRAGETDSFHDSLTQLASYNIPKYIDLTSLHVGDTWKIINDFSSWELEITFIIDDNQINEDLLESTQNIKDINYRNNNYYLMPGISEINLVEKYRVLNINVKQKKKSYELEIVESLLREYDKNNEVINKLQREKQQLYNTVGNVDDNDLETRYLDLMEKYKQSLKRLDQLRSSKLGKMQVAYWNKKRGY